MTYLVIGLALLVLIIASSKKKPDSSYSAEFVSPTTVMSVFNFGFSLAGGLRATSREIAFRNSLIVGPSGSGKTSTVLIGSIFTLARGKASMCIVAYQRRKKEVVRHTRT